MSFFKRPRKEQKYHNRRVTVFGITFDSKKEADRYLYLKAIQDSGVISNLRTQVNIELIPAVTETVEVQMKTKVKTKEVTLQKPIYYRADFVYDLNGEEIVEDVKPSRDGFKFTKEFAIKKKLYFFKFRKEIKLVYDPLEKVLQNER
jgi:hypothetical protein